MQVLILDDAEQTDLRIMAEAAESLGYDVERTADLERFREVASAGEHDLQIVDHKLDNVTKFVGLRDGPDIVALNAAEFSNVPTVMFTNYTPDCEGSLAKYDPRLATTVVAKPPPPRAQGAWRDRLEGAIAELTSRPIYDQGERLGVPLDEMQSSFFELSPQKLESLDEDARDNLESEVSLELHANIEPIWMACEDDWLMLQRMDDSILVVDRGTDEHLVSDEEMARSEAERGSVALLLGRPTVVEEISSLIECPPHAHTDWRKYPYVRLMVGQKEREFHLDTGANKSFVSLDFLKETLNLRTRRPKRAIVSNSGQEIVQGEIPVELDMYVLGAGGNVALSMRVHAVKDWHMNMLNPTCPSQRCPDSARGQCGRRLGLIGRDMLYAHEQGLWQFDPASGCFSAVAGPRSE